MKINGQTFTVLTNVRERSAARMFLEDPSQRLHPDKVNGVLSTRGVVQALDSVLYRNPLFSELTTWHEDVTAKAHLWLKWEGSTSGLRAISIDPDSAVIEPRTVVVLSRAEVDYRKLCIRATNDMYPLLMWPLAFPRGQRLKFWDGANVDDWLRKGGRVDGRNLNLQKSTLVLMLQPERRSDDEVRGAAYGGQQRAGAFSLVPTTNPYTAAFPNSAGPRVPFLYRRFNRFQLLGKLGDEFLLDRWNSVQDHRRHMLSRSVLQRRLTGTLGIRQKDEAEERADGIARSATTANAPMMRGCERDDDLYTAHENGTTPERATFLPSTEEGSPLNQYEKTGDCMYMMQKDGPPLFFTTMTFDPTWMESSVSLPLFDPMWTDTNNNHDAFANSPGGRGQFKQTADGRWAHVSTGEPPYKVKQDVYEATSLHGEVWEYKYRAFSAVMRSGTIFRNVGRPRLVGYRTVASDNVDEPPTQVPLYEYPLAVDRQPDGTQGWDAHAIEYQGRNFSHGHKATRPAKIPRSWNVSNAAVGEDLSWVDALMCTRLPDRSVLIQFGMIGKVGDWKLLDGVCKLPGDASSLHGAYEYLNLEYADNDMAVHPDIVHDYGDTFEDPNVLLSRLTFLVAGQAPRLRNCTVRIEGLNMRGGSRGFHRLNEAYNDRVGVVVCDWLDPTGVGSNAGPVGRPPAHVIDDSHVVVHLRANDEFLEERVAVPRAYIILVDGDPTHYSCGPYETCSLKPRIDNQIPVDQRRGRMIHNHPKGPHIPNGKPCGDSETCTKAHFPKKISRFTTLDEQKHLLHHRGPADIMVVGWNAWVMLYFTAHINVEVIVSATNVISYMFKMFSYMNKGVQVGDSNRAYVGPPEEQSKDKVGEFFWVKETSGTEAFHRMAQMPTTDLFPTCNKFVIHEQRTRSNDPREDDDGLSEQEAYLARPSLVCLDDLLLLDFHSNWLYARKLADAPNRHLSPFPNDPSCLLHYTKDGRPVYVGNATTQLRHNGRNSAPCIYWERTPVAQLDPMPRWRLKPASVKHGDAHYIRRLALLFPARSYEDWLTSRQTGMAISAQQRCLEEGLLEDLQEGRHAMVEAVDANDSAAALRSLFVQLSLAEYPMEEVFADDSIRAAMSADFAPADADEALLADLRELYSASESGQTDAIRRWLPSVDDGCAAGTEVERETATYDANAQRSLADSPSLALDGDGTSNEQTRVVRWVLTGRLEGSSMPLREEDFVPPNGVEVLIAHGDAGVGKSRIAKRALAEVRARGHLARACAFTWCAAANYTNGTSLHALGCMPSKGKHADTRPIALKPFGGMTPERMELLQSLAFIVYDEGFNGHRHLPEALIVYLKSIGCNVRILIPGDSQQLSATVPNGTTMEKVDASLISSQMVFHDALRVHLLVQHRQSSDPLYGRLVQTVGNGSAPSLGTHALHQPGKGQLAVALPLITHVYHTLDDSTVEASMRRALEWLFGRVDEHGLPNQFGRLCTDNVRRRTGEVAAAYANGVKRRVVICATNHQKDVWNELIHQLRVEDRDRLGGDNTGRAYKSVDCAASVGDDNGEHELAEQSIAENSNLYQHLDASVPKSILQLQIGDVVMLAKTICSRSGLVKNEIYTIAELRTYTVVVQNFAEVLHTIPRTRFVINVNAAGNIKIARKQFPFHHAWAITVHKSQGATLERSLLDLCSVYWEHGQGYVAIGRTQRAVDTGAFVNDNCSVSRDGGGPPVPIMAVVCLQSLLAR